MCVLLHERKRSELVLVLSRPSPSLRRARKVSACSRFAFTLYSSLLPLLSEVLNKRSVWFTLVLVSSLLAFVFVSLSFCVCFTQNGLDLFLSSLYSLLLPLCQLVLVLSLTHSCFCFTQKKIRS